MVARARAASGRSKTLASLVALAVVLTAALVYVEIARAAITVTAGSATATADQANAGTFVAVTTITVAEGANGDFGGNVGGGWATTNVTLATPTGWEYDTATAPTYTPSGGNLSTVTSVYNSSTSLEITLTGSGKNSADSFTITNLRVRPTSTNPLNSGSIVPTGVNRMAGIVVGSTVFANLTETAGAAARLALSGATSSTAGVNSGSITATITDDFGNVTTRGSDTIITPSSSSTSGSKVFKTTGGSPQATFTITAGTSTVSFLYYDETAGSYNITLANDGGLTNPAAYPFTVNAAAATKIALSGATSSTAGVNSASITATLQDQFNNTATRGSDTIITPSSSSTSGSKVFKTTGGSPQATFTITAGTSTVSFLYYDETAGSYSITLTNDGGLTNPAAYAFTVNAAAAAALTLSGASSSTAGVNSASITATLVDAFGNSATRGSNTIITPSSSSTSGSKAFKTTGGTPQATFTITAGTSTVSFLYYDETAGSYTITLTNDSSLTNPAPYAFTVDAAAASQIALGGPASVTAGVNSTAFTATLQDAFDNTATRGSDTVITPASSSTSGSKVFKTTGGTPQATFTITAGSSTVQFLYYDETAGAYNITLTNDSSLTNPAAHPITVNAAAATKLALSGPASVTAGVDTTAFTATLQDAFDNTATRGSDTIITPASSSTSGTKVFKTTGGTPQATFTITAGTSTVQFLYYDETAGSYNVTLTNDSGLTNPAAHPITVNAAAAAKLVLSGPASVTAGVNSTAFTATLQDQFDNTATRGSDTVITPASSSTSGSKVFKTTGGTPQATYTITTGSSTVQFLYYDETAGSYNITLTNDASLTNPAAHPITVNAAAATKIALSGPASVTAGVNSTAFTATLQDAFDNTATRGLNTIVTPASSSTSGSKVFKTTGGTPQVTFTITAGTSTVQFLYYDETAGAYNITLTDDSGLSDPAAHPITVNAAAATKIALSGPASVTAGVNSTAFTATLQDQFDNTATRGSDTVITPASSSSSGSKVFKTTGGSPQATFTITAGTSTVQFLYYDETAGAYNITLTNDASLTNPAAHPITVNAAAASKIALSGPASVTAGVNTTAFTATLQDAFDNTATRGSDTVITPASSSTSGSKVFKTTGGSPQATYTITAGTSTVQFLYYDETAGAYNITLTNDSSLTNPAAHPITVNAAAASKIALSGPASVTAGVNTTAFTATLQDAFDNTATRGSDTVITPASSSTSGSKVFKTTGGSPQATFTITAGTSTVQFLYYDEAAGAYNVTLTNDASLTNPAAHPITVNAAAATKLALGGPASVTAGVNTTAFTATLQDQFDNASSRGSNTVITPASSSTSGSKVFKTTGGTPQATFTITAGSSTVQFLYYDETAGSYNITLTNDASLTNPAAHPITVDAAAATKLVITSVNGGSNPVATAPFDVVVRSQDPFDNFSNVSGATGVSLSRETGTGTLGGTTTGTISAGTSSVTISGVTYSVAESGVSLRVTRTSGDTLTDGVSATFTVDSQPTVTNVTSAKANGSYTVGEVIDLDVVFSEPVDVTGTPQLELETGTTDRQASYLSGSGTDTLTFRYTVAAGDTSSDLDYTGTGALTLNGGTIRNAALVNAQLTLPAPGAAGSLGANKALVIDTTAPTVSNVTSAKANGSYTVGETIDVDVEFSEAVTVTGTPQLELETGVTDRQASYLSGSGTSTLIFRYTVAAGDTSSDLDYTGTTALTLNAGTIRDPATNNATLTLAAPGAAGSLGANKNLVIDTTAPTVSSIVRADPSPTNAASVDFTVTFDDDVSGTVAAADFALTTTGTATGTIGTPTTSDGITWTVPVASITGDGTLRLDFTGLVTDDAGNVSDGNDFTTGQTYTIDNTIPAVSSIVRADPTPTNADDVDFTVSFNDDVSGTVAASDFALTTTGSASGTIGAPTTSDGITWTVPVASVAGDGTLRLDFTGLVTDDAGNVSDGNDFTTGQSYTIDNTIPAVSSIVRADPTPTNADDLDFTVSFNDDVSGTVAAADFALTTTGTASGTIGAPTTSDGITWTVPVASVAGDGTLRLDFTGLVTDDAGNASDGSDFTSGQSYTIDNTIPAVSSIVRADPSPTNAASVDFTVTFDDDVSGTVTAGDFVLTTTGSAGGTIGAPTGGPTIWTVPVTGVAGDGTLRLDFTGLVTDDAGNVSDGTDFTSGEAYTIDNTIPAVSSIVRADPSPTNASSVDFTVTFNDDVTGSVAAGDFALTATGSASGTIGAPTTGDGIVWTVPVTGIAGDGTLRLDFTGLVTDDAGNDSDGSDFTTGQAYTVDRVLPAVTSILRADPNPTNADDLDFTVTFNDDVSGTVAAGDFVLTTTGSAGGTIGAPTTSDGIVWTVPVTSVAGDGTLRLDFTGLVTDDLGNASDGSDFTTGQAYVVDNTLPAVSSIVRADPNPTNAASVDFTVTFDDDVSGSVTAGDFALTATGTASGTIGTPTGGPIIWTVPVSSVAGDGTLRLDFTGLVTDDAGNVSDGGDFTTGQAYTVDRVLPAVSSILRADPSPTNANSVDFTVTFNDDVSGSVTAADFALTATGTASGTIGAPTGGPTVWTVPVSSVAGDGTLRLDFTGLVTDDAGNDSDGSDFTTGQAYTIDNTIPAVSSIVRADPSPTNAASVDFTVTFSESVSGVAVGDFALDVTGVTGASITGVTGSGSSYTVSADTGSGDGTVSIDFTGLVTDDAGNDSDGSDFTAGELYVVDKTIPTVSSIVRADPNPTDANSVDFTVTFDDDVSGSVGAGDFALTATGTASGTIGAPTTGEGITWTVPVTGVAGDGTLRLDFTGLVTDDAGNDSDGSDFTSGQSYTIDNTIPAVSSIVRADPSPTNAGSVDFTVTFSESVSGVAPGDFVLDVTGVAGASITGVSGSGSSYTVSVDTGSGDGTVSIDFTGLVTDDAGNVSDGSDFTAGELYTIDKTIPAISSIVRADPSPTNAASVDFTVTFSESVSGVAVGDFALTTTGTASGAIGAPTGGPIVWTVPVTGITGDGTLRLDFTGLVTDDAGNVSDGSDFTSGQAYTVDRVIPAVSSIVRADPNPTNADDVDFTVTFDDDVSGSLVAGDFALTTTGTASGTIGAPTTSDGIVWTVPVSSVAGDGTLRLEFTGLVTDDVGNVSDGSDFTSGQAYVIDNTLPAVSSIVRADPNPTNAASVDFTVTFSESVTGVATGDFVLTTTGSASGTIGAPTGGPIVWTVPVTGITGDGTLRLEFTGLVTDDAGNVSDGSDFTTGQAYTVDRVLPAVTSIVRADPSPTNANSVDFTVTFNDDVTGSVVAGDFVLTTTGSAGGTIGAPTTSDGIVWTVSVTSVAGDGTLRLDFTGLVTDDLGNISDGSDFTTGQAYTIDNTIPAVSSIVRADPNPTNAASIDFTVTFDDDVSDVAVGDFALDVTGVTGASITGVTGSGSSYTVSVDTGTGDGTVGIDFTGLVTDDAGNVSDGSDFTTGDAYTIDKTVPAVLSITLADPDPTAAASVDFTVTFSESVRDTGVGTGDFAIDATGIAGASVTGVSGSTDTYTVTVDTGSGDGSLSIDFTGVATDTAGNDTTGSFTAGAAYTVDKSAPSVSSITAASPTNAASIDFTVTFSEAVTGGGAGNFTLATTDVSGASITAVSGSGATRTVSVDTGTGDGTIRLDLTNSTGLADSVGNPVTPSTFTTGTTITVDKTQPTVTDVTSPKPNGAYTVGEAIDVHIAFSEPVNVTGTPTLELETGGIDRTATYASGSGSSTLVFTYTVAAGDTSSDLDYTGTGALTGTIRDDAANDAVLTLAAPGASGSLGANEALVVDTTAPSVSSIVRADPSPTNADSVDFTVTFSESVTGVAAADFALTATGTAGGTIGTPTGGPTIWTVPVTGVAGDGTLRLDFTGLVTDDAGNVSDGSDFTSGETYTVDRVIPAVTSIVRADPSPTNASSVDFTVSFDDDVSGTVTAADFALTATGTAGGTIGAPTTSDGITWTIPVSGISGDGTLRLDFTGLVTDDAGNDSDGSDFTTGQAYTVDRVIPAVTSIVRADGNPTNADDVDFTVTFDDNVSGTVEAGDFALTTTGTATGTIGAPTTSNGLTWTVPVSTVAGDGTLRLDFTGLVTDDVGNVSDGSDFTSAQAYLVDNTLPAVTSIERSDPSPTNAASVDFTVIFDDDVAGSVAAADFALTTTGTATGTVGTPTGGPIIWTVPVTGVAGDGTLRIDFTGLVTDDAGNVSDGTDFTTGEAYTIDRVIPAVTSIVRADPSPTSADDVDFAVTFDDDVSGTVTAADFTLATTGTAAGTIGAPTTSDGITWTVPVSTVGGDGTLRLDFTGFVTDDVGNVSDGSDFTSGQAYVIDNSLPAVIDVTSPEANGAYTAGEAIDIHIVFSEPVTVTGTPTLELETGGIDRTATYTSVSGSSTLVFAYNIQSGDTSLDLDYTGTGALTLNGGAIRDTALNDATLTLPAPGSAGSLGANKALVIDTSAPSAPTLTLSESAGDLHADGTTLWFATAANGNFTVAATTADAQSGIAKVAFPAVGALAGGDDTVAPYQHTYSGALGEQLGNGVVAHNNAGLTNSGDFDVREDATAPTVGAISVPQYSPTLGLTITTTSFGDADSGIATNVITRSNPQDPATPGTCPAAGWTGATVVTSPDTVPTDGKCYRYTLTGTDNVGNAASVTADVLVDTTPPSQPDLSLSTSSANVYADNGETPKTVWFKPGTATGSFTVNATTTDDESGVKQVEFGAVSGLTGDGPDPSEPFQATYSWSVAPSSASGSVSAVNRADLTSPVRVFDLAADGIAPTGGSISVPQFSSSQTITITTTDFTDDDSGIATNVITRAEADLSGPGACGSFSGATVVTSPDTVPNDGKCYRYTLTGTDNVGNTASVTADVLVDTTPPSAPALTLSPSSPNVHVTGGTVWFRPGTADGAFTVAATTDDGESGVDEVAFPAVGALSGTDDDTAPYEHTYAWTGGAPASSAGNAVSAVNRAGGSSVTTFDFSSDGTDPSGGAVDYPNGAQTDSAPDVNVTMPVDNESGLATVVLQQVYHGASCGAPGTPTDVQTVSASGSYNVILTQGFGCYTFQLYAEDNVGNDIVFTSPNEYELTGSLSLETIELTSPESQHFAFGNVYVNTAASGTFQLKVTDAVAPDVVSVDFPAIPGLTGDPTTGNSAPFESDVYEWDGTFAGSGLVTVTLHMAVGPDQDEQIQVVVDTTDPTATDDTGSIGNDWKSSAQTVTLTPADAGSGVAAVHYTTDGSTPTTGSPSGTTITLNASGEYTIKYFAVDNVGNEGAVQIAGTQIRIDLDAPGNSFTATSVAPAGTVFASGTDVWFKGSTAGSFALENNLTDGHSGPASTTFSALAEPEWTAKAVETVATAPYVSSLFERTDMASGSFSFVVTGEDEAGNATATTLTFREDSTAPTTGDNYGSIGSTWYSTPQTLMLTPDDGAGSGVGATFYSLDGGATYAPGSSVTLSTTGVYDVTFYSVDNVGNAETPPRTVGPIRIDATAPTNSISLVNTSPSGSAYLSGTTLFYRGAAAGSFQLENALPAIDSGPFGTTFGAVSSIPNWADKSAETVTAPAGGPFRSMPFNWTAGAADFTETVTGIDNAGNSTDTVLTVTDDSAAPLVSDDTASITDAWRNTNTTVTLTASDSGSGVADVYYRVNGGAWTPGTSISLTATGVYTIEYYAVDNVGNESAVQTGAAQIRIDKIAPSGAVTDPAAGATLSGSAAQLSATGSDSISGVASVQFEVRPAGSMGAFSNAGLPVTMPPYDATWDTTTFANGDYELRAFVTDLAGNTFATVTRTITVSNVAASGPATTVIPAGTMTDTILPVPGTLNTVTVPGGSAIETLVIKTEARLDLESTPPAGSSFGGNVVEVEACVAGAGVSTASVDACLATGGTPLTDLPMAWKVSLLGTGFPARSSNGSGWSELPAESYLAAGGGFDLYVKSLSFFTLLVPQEGAVALAQPNLVGVVQYGLLKLRWSPSGGVSPIKAYELFVDGKSDRYFGEVQYEEILGQFSPTDTRVFELQAVDIRGRISPLSNAVTSVPELMGLTVAEARVALAGRGFGAVLSDPSASEGDTVVRQSPAAPALATVGNAVTLVTSGGEGHAALRLQVSNSLRVVLGLHTLNVRVALTAPAMVSAKLFSRDRFVRAKTGRLVPWEAFYKPRRVEAGATIVPFRLLRTLSQPGGYVLLVTARSLSGGSVTQSRTPITVVRPAVQRIVVGQARVDVPVTLVQPSVVTVQLVSKAKIAKTKTGKRVPWRKTWSGRRVESGTTILSLPLPRSLKRPGAYRLVVISRAVATGKVTRRQMPITVVRKASRETKSVDVVVLTGKDVTPSTPLKPDEGVTINQADDADQVFTTTSTPSANVQVIVIDVGGTEDIELIRQLRLVYPDLKIIAVVPQGLGAAAREAGATIVVMKPASPELISTLINRLATNGNGSGRGSRG